MKVCPRCSELYPDAATKCARDGRTLKTVNDPLLGRTIGSRYRLISRLGSGGMSSVYLARHVLIDRLMAIKILRRDLAQFPIHRDRFLREARAVNRINHENIVEITDFGEADDGLVYLVMEYIAGEPLHQVVRKGPLALMRAVRIAGQVASALGRAHQMGVIHRDLKPENILLVARRGRSDFVKILDFGIAKILDAPSLTGNQQIFGTPGYIAPEYVLGGEIDARTDLYSLGVVLYEMVTGKLPHDYQYPGDLLVKHATEPPIPPSTRLPSLPSAVDSVVLKLLAKEPAARYRDAFALQAALEQLAAVVEGGDEGWPAGADSGASFPAGAPAAAAPSPTPAPASSAAEPSVEPSPPQPSRSVLAAAFDPLVDARTDIDAPVPELPITRDGPVVAPATTQLEQDPDATPAAPPSGPLEVAESGAPAAEDAAPAEREPPAAAEPASPPTATGEVPARSEHTPALGGVDLRISGDSGDVVIVGVAADDYAVTHERVSSEPERPSAVSTPHIPFDPLLLGRTIPETGLDLFETSRMPPAPAVTLADTVGVVTAWRRRFDAIRDRLDELEERQPAPVEVAQAMALAATLLDDLESRAAEAVSLQVRIDELHERGKDFRMTIGRALDELGRDRSARRDVLERLREGQEHIQAKRRLLQDKLEAGTSYDEGTADALLWEDAALTEEERSVRHEVEDLDFQIDSLRTQLERLNGALEDDLRALGRRLEAELGELLEQSRGLRAPLERAAGFVEPPAAPA